MCPAQGGPSLTEVLRITRSRYSWSSPTFQFSRAVGVGWNGWLALWVKKPPAAKQPPMKAPAHTPTRMARSHSGREGSRPAPNKSNADSAIANSAASRQRAKNHRQLKAPARQISSNGTIVDLVRRMRCPLTCAITGGRSAQRVSRPVD